MHLLKAKLTSFTLSRKKVPINVIPQTLKKVNGCLTSEETLHGFAVGHLQEAATRVRGEGGVGAVRQQDANHVQVVVLHGVVNRPEHKRRIWSETIEIEKAHCYAFYPEV